MVVPNLLERDFSADKPNQTWVTDITYIRTYEGGLYLGVVMDDMQAVALYRQGCEGGTAVGCIYLGALYEVGHGVAQDDDQAAALFRQACEGGNERGCSLLKDFQP